MNTGREKTSNVAGIVVSILLHGIFFAGCLALDASNLASSGETEKTPSEINQVADQAQVEKVKS